MIDLNYLYIGLLRDTELGVNEVPQEGTNYRRIEVGPGDLELIEDDYATNAVEIEFPNVIGAWGLIGHFGIFDSLDNKIPLAIGELDNPTYIYEGCVVKFDTGKMQIPLDELGIYDG